MHRAKWTALLATITTLATAMATPPAGACTTFRSRTPSGSIVAKSFDWQTGEGWVVLNERARTRTMLAAEGASRGAAATWTSQFASVSFTTVGPGFPISGMNEAGLVIEALVDASVAPSAALVPGRLTGLELVQRGLDSFASVAELRTFAERQEVQQLAVALHFFACDRAGECVVLETREGRTKVTDVSAGPAVLANRGWRSDVDAFKAPAAPAPAPAPPTSAKPGVSSDARFSRVATALGREAPRDAAESFRLLDGAAIPPLTKWQIVWNLERKTVEWRDRGAGSGVSSLDLATSTAPCQGAARVMPIGRPGDFPLRGFAPWSEGDAARANASLVRQLGASPRVRLLAERAARARSASVCAK